MFQTQSMSNSCLYKPLYSKTIFLQKKKAKTIIFFPQNYYSTLNYMFTSFSNDCLCLQDPIVRNPLWTGVSSCFQMQNFRQLNNLMQKKTNHEFRPCTMFPNFSTVFLPRRLINSTFLFRGSHIHSPKIQKSPFFMIHLTTLCIKQSQ